MGLIRNPLSNANGLVIIPCNLDRAAGVAVGMPHGWYNFQAQPQSAILFKPARLTSSTTPGFHVGTRTGQMLNLLFILS